jgi:Ca-activated chloride channel family protein
MNRIARTRRVDLERRLAEPLEGLDAAPPEDLLDRLKEDIPPTLATRSIAASTSGRRFHPRRWALAASLAVAALAGFLARRGMEEGLAPVEPSLAASFEESRAQAPDAAGSAGSQEPPTRPAPIDEFERQIDPRVGADRMARGQAGGGDAEARKVPNAKTQPAPGSAAQSPRSEPTAASSQSGGVDTGLGAGRNDALVHAPAPLVGEEPVTDDFERVGNARRRGAAAVAPMEVPPAAPAAPAPPPAAAIGLASKASGESKRDLQALGYVGGELDDAGAVVYETITVTGEKPLNEVSRVAAASRLADDGDQLSRAPQDMFFRDHGRNPYVDPRRDPRSTFGLDVDTGSFALARRYLSDGNLPPRAAVRVEEIVNALRYDTPRTRTLARGEAPLDLLAEGAPTPFFHSSRDRLVRLAVAARAVDPHERKPAVLTFVVDTSGSMDQENRLGLVKRSLGVLLGELRADDRVGLVIYDDEARVVVRPTDDHGRVREALGRLRPGGSTNAEDGLALAYRVAGDAWQADANNRVILASDGVANVGATGPESILAVIGREARRGIYLTTVGFGMGNYNDALMERLADQGNGNYAYVDSLEEARKIFRQNLSATLETLARDAKAQVEFDPRTVEHYRLLGYENRDIADEKFRDDTVDAGEIGAGHRVTALYEVRLREGVDASQQVLVFRLRYRDVETRQIEETRRPLLVSELDETWWSASQDLRTAAVGAEFAERLRSLDGGRRRVSSWDVLRREAAEVARRARESSDTTLEDLRGMIDRAARLAGPALPED